MDAAVAEPSNRPVKSMSDWPRTLGLAVSSALAWALAAMLQGSAQGFAWAALDIVSHAAIATLVCVWLVPRWGWRPLVAAVVAAVLIDVDHLVAARSLDPHRITTLKSRPPTHSLASVAVISLVVGVLGGKRIGYAVLLGLLTHIARDATEFPGVPLWVPFNWNLHVMLDDRWMGCLLAICVAANFLLLVRYAGLSLRKRARYVQI